MLFLLFVCALGATSASIPDAAASRIIRKDVAILGGGASGAHAAVRLREDYGHSVVVVEAQSDLGGHVGTYTDPATGNPYDYGVNSYTEYGNAEAFFTRFNISLQTPTRLTLSTTFADFTTGAPLDGYEAPAAAAVTAGLQKYLELCEQYEDLLLPSWANFPTENVPEDLLLPFRDFVTKYGLEAIVPRVFQTTGLGMGNMMDELTMYVMQTFGAPIVRTFLGLKNSWVPTTRRNQDLYDSIGALLGKDVLYSSRVIQADRSDNGTLLLVQGANGTRILIKARRLLVSFAPIPENLQPIDTDQAETDVFSVWRKQAVFAGIVTHPSLPINGSIVNYPASVVPNHWLELPESPFVGRFENLGDTNFRVLVTGTADYDIPAAEALAQDAFDRLAATGVVANGTAGQPLNFAALAAHISTNPHVSAEQIKSGFYQRLYALQGRRGTFWTGGAWSADFSTTLWEYNDQYLLPKLLASLGNTSGVLNRL